MLRPLKDSFQNDIEKRAEQNNQLANFMSHRYFGLQCDIKLALVNKR